MFYGFKEFYEIFEKISKRVDQSMVFNDFLNYALQKIENKEINLNYNYTEDELSYFNDLFECWETQMNTINQDYFDFFGRFYEDVILAGNKASSKGQFFTPEYICDVLVYLAPEKNIAYDPACGSGRMLLSYLINNPYSKVIGEDLDELSCKMTVLNIWGHKRDGAVNWIDSLSREHYNTWIVENGVIFEKEEPYPLDYGVVVANPPYGVKWDANKELLKVDERFKPYGALAPKSKGDYAFIQHCLHGLSDKGQANILMPHGVLFRGASEGKIREKILEYNYLDAVIGLPANLFKGTGIPTVLLIFKKNRRNNDIFFIDASKEYEKGKPVNIILEEQQEKIILEYLDRIPHDRFSYKSKISEIEDNDYNLNIPRYVDTFEEPSRVDLDKVVDAMEYNYDEMKQTNHLIKEYCDELGIRAPLPNLQVEDDTSIVVAARDIVQDTRQCRLTDFIGS